MLTLSCVCCGAPGVVLCGSCVSRLEPAGELAAPMGTDACVALIDYAGVGRDVVLALKYGNARSLVTALGAALSDAVRAGAPDVVGRLDVVTWAPTSSRRRRQRGFDQAQLVARSVARQLGLPCRRLLVRHPGPAQTGRSRPERLRGPAFEPRGRGRPADSVLVIDDVITSGATLAAAAGALRAGGAATVVAAAVARTP